MKFRRKNEVEAIHFVNDNSEDVIQFINDHGGAANAVEYRDGVVSALRFWQYHWEDWEAMSVLNFGCWVVHDQCDGLNFYDDDEFKEMFERIDE